MANDFTWSTASPSDHGLDPQKLDALWQEIATRHSKTFLVVRHDHIVYERYADDWPADKPHHTASLAKAIVGGLSLMLAIDDGLICTDDFAHHYIPQWRDDPLKAKITIRHLATHTSGIEDAELSEADRANNPDAASDHMEMTGWKGDFWRQEPDPFTIARDHAPVLTEPGTQYAYSNPGIALLTYVVTAAIKDAPVNDIRTLLKTRIFDPLGIQDSEWTIGYNKTFTVDGLPHIAGWGGGGFTARATARIGRLLLHDGQWQGVQLIGPAALRASLAYAGMPVPDRSDGEPWPGAGLSFWLNFDGVWPAVPKDAFGGAGAGNQHLIVVPSLDLIIVRNGASLDPDTKFAWKGFIEHVLNPLMKAFELQPPYPYSPVIKDIQWAPIPQIARLAMGGRTRDGSDNWPMTWADDGHLYTAYGDGFGFEPGTEKKLGMGLAVVTGGPDDFTGLNIRSDAENESYGGKGEKSSGLLMIDHVLYMWVRNANRDGEQSRLGWSVDHGKSWTWSDWVFAELGHPAFINFGQHYAGARDDYVYIVSHDDPSAYVQADHFVLLRVPKEQLRERTAYEFFTGLDDGGDPLWSTNIADRAPVFTHKGQARRSSISYNAPLGRYFWWQQMTVDKNSSDTRFSGGFALFDAPEPWGPWTTVYYTDNWDIGPGDLACIPTKWINADGQTFHLVVASNDHFAVRKATLTIGE